MIGRYILLGVSTNNFLFLSVHAKHLVHDAANYIIIEENKTSPSSKYSFQYFWQKCLITAALFLFRWILV